MYIGRINNFRGVKKAEIEIEKLTGIFGRNGSGKSSIAQALGAVLSGTALPIKGILKKDALLLVHDASRKGEAAIIGKDGESFVRWPTCTFKHKGKAPETNEVVVGLESIDTIPAKDLPNVMSKYMNMYATKDELKKSLSEAGVSETSIDRIWDSIQELGWDATTKNVETKTTELKGRWREVAKRNYGSAVAENWMPENYSSDMDSKSEEHYQQNLSQCQEFLEAAIQYEAVSEAKVEEYREEAETIPDLENKIQENAALGKKLYEDKNDVIKQLGDLPKNRENAKCPHCEKGLVVDGLNVNKPVELSKEKIKEIEKRRKDLTKELEDLTEKYSATKKRNDELRTSLASAENAYKKLSKFDPNNKPEMDVDTARNNLQKARDELEAFQSKHKADNIQQQIKRQKKISDIISPSGLRREKLIEAIGKFNKTMSDIIPEWKVAFNDELGIEKNGRAFGMLSKSQQHQCRIAFQLGIAKLCKSDVVIIDEVDMFDKNEKTILFKNLKKMGIHAVVCATMNSMDKSPNLKKLGHGRSYWVENGEVKEIE